MIARRLQRWTDHQLIVVRDLETAQRGRRIRPLDFRGPYSQVGTNLRSVGEPQAFRVRRDNPRAGDDSDPKPLETFARSDRDALRKGGEQMRAALNQLHLDLAWESSGAIVGGDLRELDQFGRQFNTGRSAADYRDGQGAAGRQNSPAGASGFPG